MNLHPHESARLRDLRPGEELLVVRPVVPQPMMVRDGESEVACCECGGAVVEFTVPTEEWNRIVRQGGPETAFEYLCVKCFSMRACPHRPGDAVEVQVESGVCHCGELVDSKITHLNHLAVDMPYTYRLAVTHVEAKRVREIAEGEWRQAGLGMFFGILIRAGYWWDTTYAPLGPEYAWDRAWCWCEWWSLAAAQAAGGKDDIFE